MNNTFKLGRSITQIIPFYRQQEQPKLFILFDNPSNKDEGVQEVEKVEMRNFIILLFEILIRL
jgi:hypothetical protein